MLSYGACALACLLCKAIPIAEVRRHADMNGPIELALALAGSILASRSRFLRVIVVRLATPVVSLVFLASCTRREPPVPPPAESHPAPVSTPVSAEAHPAPLLTAIAVPASSGSSGFDSLVTLQRPTSTCYASARYVVVERELLDNVGADLYVRPRAAPDAPLRCDADSLGGDILFRTGEAAQHHPEWQHFLGLKGDLLVAWDGTGAASDLYIYDLTKRAKVLFIEGADDATLAWLSPMTLGVWVTKAAEKEAAAAGCPDTMPANPALLDSLMSVDLRTMTLRPTGRYRCRVGQ